MICWIASYPKSGNTFLRILLSDYLYGNFEKPFNFSDLDKVNQFPTLFHYSLLLEEGLSSKLEMKKHEHPLKWSSYLQKRYFNNGLFFLKTHSCNFITNNYHFTDPSITSCAIYITRDPRNVLFSYSEYLNETVEDTYKKITSDNFQYQRNKKEDEWYPIYYLASWKNNYLSWKKAQLSFPIKFIKFEDLVTNTKEVFADILLFLKKYTKINIDLLRLNRVIERTTFAKLQQLEDQGLFTEAPFKKEISKFFNKGTARNWKDDKTNLSFVDKINNIFSSEITNLNY